MKPRLPDAAVKAPNIPPPYTYSKVDKIKEYLES